MSASGNSHADVPSAARSADRPPGLTTNTRSSPAAGSNVVWIVVSQSRAPVARLYAASWSPSSGK